MWRREVIRWVLALNWCVAGLSFANAVYAHGHLWGSNCWAMAREDLPFPDDPKADLRKVEEAQFERKNEYEQRTKWVGESGQRGWWLACAASTGTAILLMIAFPKKTGSEPTR